MSTDGAFYGLVWVPREIPEIATADRNRYHSPMADNDDYRVEPRQSVVGGGGMNATPERIAELAQRQAKMERMARTPPKTPFSDVLAKGKAAPEEKPLSEKEKKLQALPKKGPRPAMSHPALKKRFGRSEESKEDVVLKG